jgi:DNA (cytosine-5)-methyltransferase 1
MSWLYLPGGGGGLLASKLSGNRIVCYVEWDKYCVEVLKARIRDGYLDDAPIWDDCFSFDGYPWAGHVDIISAGFPCQPFSAAGKGLAEHDPRNGWPAIKRILGEVRPNFAYLENVPGLISKFYIRRIFGDLANLGYDAEWGCLSASAIGAPHVRNRLWILAYAKGVQELLQLFTRENNLEFTGDGLTQQMADTNGSGCEGSNDLPEVESSKVGTDFAGSGEVYNPEYSGDGRWQAFPGGQEIRNGYASGWETEPELGRVADGMAHRVDRLATIGNGQVPRVAQAAFNILLERIKK